MNDRRLLRAIKAAVLDSCGEEMVSLYAMGSFPRHEMIQSSDVDLVGVMKPNFDFSKEPQINKAINREIRYAHKIDLGTMSYEEFFGGIQQGSILRHIELPILLNFLKHARLIYGKKINFDKLPIKPASCQEELEYHITVFDEYKSAFRRRYRIRSDFSFRDFLKIIFYIANLELQLVRGNEPRVAYTEIERAFRTDQKHIVHHSMNLRRKKSIGRTERQSWLDSAERYVTKMHPLASGLVGIEVVSEPSRLDAAWSNQYEKLAQVFADALGNRRRIAEVGCGRGQLTIPLARRSTKLRFILVDRFVGTNYSKNYKALVCNLSKARLSKRAEIVVSDYTEWARRQKAATYEAVISSEFIPELNSGETHQFIRECYRILKPEGLAAHSFLSPIARNFRQSLLIKADSNPLWTRTPPKQWFSPKPELVIKELRKSGFHRIRKTTLATRLVMKADAAKSWLKSAEVKSNFYGRHEKLLNESGLEVPDWAVVSGIKP